MVKTTTARRSAVASIAVAATIAVTGLRHITGTVYVTAGYVYADRTWMGCS